MTAESSLLLASPSEGVPVLYCTTKDEEENGIGERSKSVLRHSATTFATLLMSIIGAGFLSIPYIFTLLPMPAAVIVIIITGTCSTYMATLLLRVYDAKDTVLLHSYSQMIHEATKTSRPTFVILKHLTSYIIAFAIYGACVGSLVVLRDVSPSIFSTFITNERALKSIHFATLALILLPLCLRRSLTGKLLRYSSVLGFLFTLYLVLTFAARAYKEGNNTASVILSTAGPEFSISALAQSVAICNFAYVMHLNVVPLFVEARGTSSTTTNAAASHFTLEVMIFLVCVTSVVCMGFYITFGTSAWMLYGSAIHGEILLNLESDWSMQIPLIAVFVTVLSSFPMLFHPLRTILERELDIRRITAKNFLVLGLLGSQVLCSECVPGIAFVFTLTGASCCVVMCYLLPGFFFLRIVSDIDVVEKQLVYGLMGISTILGLVATYGVFQRNL